MCMLVISKSSPITLKTDMAERLKIEKYNN